MNETICTLVQELLPLYAEDLCSPQGQQAVREHLASCPACQRAYAAQQAPLAAREELPPTGNPKEPFRRIRRFYLRRSLLAAVAAVLLLAAAIPTFFSLAGEGCGWSSLFGWYTAGRAMEAIVEKDTTSMRRYIDYQPGEGPFTTVEMLQQLEALEAQGVTLLRAEDRYHPLDDGFPYCAAELFVVYDGVEYQLCFEGQYTRGKAAFAYPYEIWTESIDGRQRIDLNEMPPWMEELCAAVTTYYPG